MLVTALCYRLMTEKQRQRCAAYDARNAQPNKDKLSQVICQQFISQHQYQQADTVMWYLHCRSEVRTLFALETELSRSKRIVIPYCTTGQNGENKLGLWLLEDLSELISGTWGILEPPRDRWGERKKEISPLALDLIMVPGVAFDRQGGRIGNGAGYYDRLFTHVRSDAVLTAVCFESQLCDKVVMDQHDVTMDLVITENNVYQPNKWI